MKSIAEKPLNAIFIPVIFICARHTTATCVDQTYIERHHENGLFIICNASKAFSVVVLHTLSTQPNTKYTVRFEIATQNCMPKCEHSLMDVWQTAKRDAAQNNCLDN